MTTSTSPDRSRRHPLALLTVCTLTALASLGAQAAPAAAPRPWVVGQQTVPVFSVAESVKEVVNVQTDYDRDQDGRKDTIRVEVTRPDVAPGTKVPLIVRASPYFFKFPRERGAWEIDFFVPRGYAVATVALPGTDFSTGCEDVGGNYEVRGTKAVIDWANGRASGSHLDGSPADATAWTNGKTGMIGVSWDGTIANALASTGVKGLETIVPVAAISSWYDYTRGNGIPFYEGHVGYLASYVSNYDSPICRDLTPWLQEQSDDPTGNYNAWWSVRDFRLDASKIKASVFVVHGLSDENVKTRQFGEWWDELVKHDVPRRIYLHQRDHIDPYTAFGSQYSTPLLQWFDYYLQGLDNGLPNEPQAIIQREDQSWSTDATWPPAGTKARKVRLANVPGSAAAALTTQAVAAPAAAQLMSFKQATRYSSDSIVLNPTVPRNDRLVFLSDRLGAALRESGTAKVTLRVQVDQPAAGFQARIVDYDTDAGTAYVVSRTIADLGHYASWREKRTLVPGEWYTLTWEINTDDRVFAPGHHIGLVISAEQPNPLIGYQAVTATVDAAQSFLTIPLSGSVASLAAPGPRGPVRATATVGPREPTRDVHEFIREFFEGSR